MNPFGFEFWRAEEALLWEALAGMFLTSYLEASEGGVNTLPESLQPLVNFDVLNTAALRFANEYRYDWISKINETTRKQVQEAMANWIQSGDPLSVLESTLAPIFGSVRAEMIAATEITRIFSLANQAAWQSTGFVNQMKFNTAVDDRVCPICGPKQGAIMPLGSDQAPPLHVRCRCYLTPIVDVDAVAAEAGRILNG